MKKNTFSSFSANEMYVFRSKFVQTIETLPMCEIRNKVNIFMAGSVI